jgi:hypothetical protein
MWTTPREAARLSGITPGRLYDWIRAGRLTVRRPHGGVRGLRVSVLEVQALAGLQRGGRLPRTPAAPRSA